MPIYFPAHIGVQGLGDGVGFLAVIESDMMFEPGSADILHQQLKVWNLHDAVAAETINFVVGKFALACIDTDYALSIVGCGSAESRLVGRDSAGL